MRIRPRSVDDLAALRELADDVLRLDGYPPRPPSDLGRFITAAGALAAFVALEGDQVVGQICLSPSGSPEVLDCAQRALGVPRRHLAVVSRLLVAPAHRRAGLGRALLAATLPAAARLGRTPVVDVATHFLGAIALYERSGWRRVGQVSVRISGSPILDEFVYLGPGS